MPELFVPDSNCPDENHASPLAIVGLVRDQTSSRGGRESTVKTLIDTLHAMFITHEAPVAWDQMYAATPH